MREGAAAFRNRDRAAPLSDVIEQGQARGFEFGYIYDSMRHFFRIATKLVM
jgi:hypothetical protein